MVEYFGKGVFVSGAFGATRNFLISLTIPRNIKQIDIIY